MSLNATVALTTKTTTSQTNSNILTALSLFVHIDNSAIIISISEEQVMCNISQNIFQYFYHFVSTNTSQHFHVLSNNYSILFSQVVFMSSIIQKILNILLITNSPKESSTVVPHIINENAVVFPTIPQTPSTPTQIIYPEDTTTNSTISTSRDDIITGKLVNKVYPNCFFFFSLI